MSRSRLYLDLKISFRQRRIHKLSIWDLFRFISLSHAPNYFHAAFWIYIHIQMLVIFLKWFSYGKKSFED